MVVLRIVDHKPASTKPLADVKNEVTASIWLEKAEAKIKAVVEDVTKQLEAGVMVDAVTSEEEIEWTTVEKVTRDDVNVNRSVLRNAFQAGNPSEENPIILSNRLGSGDYAITIVSAAYDGELTAEDETTSKNYILELKRNRGKAEWQEFLKNARSNGRRKNL